MRTPLSKMNFTLVLVLLFLQVLRSSCASNGQTFYFPKVAKEISASLNNSAELNEKLELLNRDGDYIDMVKLRLGPQIMKDYIKAQEKVSCLLVNLSSPDFRNPIWFEFSNHLLISVDEESNLFNPQTLGDVFGFLLATATQENLSKLLRVYGKMITKLSSVSRSKLYQYYTKYVFSIVIPPLFDSKIFGARTVEAFAEEYVPKLINTIYDIGSIEPNHFDTICSIVFSVSKDPKINFSDYFWDSLLMAVKYTLPGIRVKNVNRISEGLNNVLLKVKHNEDLQKSIIDIAFDENLALLINRDEVNLLYLGLLINCSLIFNFYFLEAFSKASDEVKEHIAEYPKYIKMNNTAVWCLKDLKNLAPNSGEGQFRLSLSSAKNLRKFNQVIPNAMIQFSGMIGVFDSHLKRLKDALFDPSCENNSLLLQIVAHLSLLDMEIYPKVERLQSSDNIAFTIGSLLVKSENIQEFVNDVMPRLDSIIQIMMNAAKKSQKPMKYSHLRAYLSFIRLHPCSDLVFSATTDFCFVFITSIPIHDKGYAQIKYFDNFDEYSVMRAGFFYFIEKYSKSPSKGDHPHLVDYFKYLLINDCLSKTEMMAITRYFDTYGIKL